MPYKKGPNGTMRYYSKSDGRYSDDPCLISNKISKKYTRKEKIKYLQGILYNQAHRSKDKNLLFVYEVIESLNPGITRNINIKYFDALSKKYRELDIVTASSIYEVKSGKARHKEKQYLAQKKIADNLGKDYVVYSPGSSNYQVKVLKSKGINIFNDTNEFIKYEEEK